MSDPAPLVTLEAAKWHLRILDEDSDDQINQLIADATDHVERYTRHLLTEREVVETFDRFGTLKLKAWPVAADATVSITYIDTLGAPQAQTTYRLATGTRPAMLFPAVGSAWPTTYMGAGVVKATFMAGYDASDNVPPTFRRAILILLAAYFADREGGETAKKAEASVNAMLDRANLRPRTL